MVDHQLIHELFPSGEIVSEVEQVVGCFACSKPLSGFSYRCRNCPALLHEKCANLPTLISNHALHRRHSLKLFMDPLPNYSGRNYCKLCFSRINGKLAYRCVTDCKFILDINCATLPKFLVGSFPEQQHFSHEHPLVSIDDHVDEAEINTCNSCKMSIPGGPINVCLQCDFWLHRKCFDLPQKTSHPRHRKHPLMLVVASSVLQSNINRVCGVCDKRIWEWSFYHCHFCMFDIHVDCAFLPWILKSEAHPHSFDLLLRKCKFMSDGCGRKVQGAPYLCIECNLVQHKDFFDMPHSIKVAQHHHKLVHTFSTSTIEELDEIEYCRMCHNELNPRFLTYKLIISIKRSKIA